jgi:hypothetical protein
MVRAAAPDVAGVGLGDTLTSARVYGFAASRMTVRPGRLHDRPDMTAM